MTVLSFLLLILLLLCYLSSLSSCYSDEYVKHLVGLVFIFCAGDRHQASSVLGKCLQEFSHGRMHGFSSPHLFLFALQFWKFLWACDLPLNLTDLFLDWAASPDELLTDTIHELYAAV